MSTMTVGADWRLQVAGFSSLGMHAVLSLGVVCLVALLAGQIVRTRKFPLGSEINLGMRVGGDFSVTGVTLDPQRTVSRLV